MKERQIVSLLPLLALVLLGASFVLKRHVSEDSCHKLLKDGRWTKPYQQSDVGRQWQPFGTLLHKYDAASVVQCLSDRNLHFIGGSTIRQVFWATAEKLGGEDAHNARSEAGKHEDVYFVYQNTTINFLWDPYLNRTETTALLNITTRDNQAAAVLLSVGLWHARYGGPDYLEDLHQTMSRIIPNVRMQGLPDSTEWTAHNKELYRIRQFSPVIALPPPHLNTHRLSHDRASTLTTDRVEGVISELEAYDDASPMLEVAWAAREMTRANPFAIDSSGLHVIEDIAATQADLLLNRVCNDQVFADTNKASSHACVVADGWIVVNFRTLLTVILTGLWVVYLYQRRFQGDPHLKSRLWATFTVLVIASYCWLADRTRLFEKSHKIISDRLFVIFVCASLAAGIGVIGANSEVVVRTLPMSKTINRKELALHGLLSRAQTEEWKGWMQVIILLYHFFGMSKVLWVYRVIRVLVASYLFLTGYGQATQFQTAADFSIKRVAMVLIRLNLLPCLLTILMNNTYDFYYFPGLASVWFLITYATFWNSPGRVPMKHEIVGRIVLSCVLVRSIFLSEHCTSALARALYSLGGPHIDAKEFRFRISLDVFSPYFGMLVAFLQHQPPETVYLISRVVARMPARILQAGIVTVACFMLAIYFSIATRFDDKYKYNHWHPLLSLLPITAYIILRNLNETLRSYVAPTFIWIGSISLETFILQYHIWLAADTKGLLHLGLVDIPFRTSREQHFSTSLTVIGAWTFWIEAVIVTVVFLWASDACARATNVLVRWFIDVPNQGEYEKRRSSGRLLTRLLAVVVILWLYNVAAKADKYLSSPVN